ncbi:radical SAM protein, partial [Bacillus spizizenii]
MNKLNEFPEKLQGILSNKSQELIIFPTEQCNFRCTYCYEDFSLGKMSNEIVGGVKKFLYRRIPELDSLHLSWFGGEPLVAKDIVFDISEYASSLAKKHNTTFIGSMTTNGYNLSLKTFSKLVDFGVTKYQISLDGSRNTHNTTRLRADGKGTFDRIWGNLLNIRKSDLNFSITLRVHLDNNNVDQIESLLKDL